MTEKRMPEQQFKRNIAYKYRIGTLLTGKPIIEAERMKLLEIGDKQVVRANVIANIIDKYIQEGEKKFGSLTLDDGTGQIKVKTFGDDVEKLMPYNQGDTVAVIGLIRSWNNEIYMTPDIIKKKEPLYLLIRKAEVESNMPKVVEKPQLAALKEKIIEMLKTAEKDGGIDIEKIILELKERPDTINQEIKRLLEGGIAYEPRPGKLRWLG